MSKIFRLSLSNSCKKHCCKAHLIGFPTESEPFNLNRIKKLVSWAKKNAYSSLMIPSCACNLSELKQALNLPELESIDKIILSDTHSQQEQSNRLPEYSKNNKINYACIISEDSNFSKIQTSKNFTFIFVPKASRSLNLSHINFPELVQGQIYFYFPNRFSPYEVKNYINKVQSLNQSFIVQPLEGLSHSEMNSADIPPPDANYSVKYENHSKEAAPLLSIVIPFRNNFDNLKHCLDSLRQQNINNEMFEIIIVDDGCIELERNLALEQLNSYGNNFYGYYLQVPRTDFEILNKAYFKSGQIRNIGSNKSKGEYLLFLDSDIILPRNYLNLLRKKMSENVVIQPRRKDVCITKRSTSYDDIANSMRTQFSDNGFLIELENRPWNSIKNKWRFVCSYCLCINRGLFMNIGQFNNSFTTYGHEDTELGFRLARIQCEFQFEPTTVFHSREGSGLSVTDFLEKRRKLAISAHMFYITHLSDEIFNEYLWLWGAYPNVNYLQIHQFRGYLCFIKKGLLRTKDFFSIARAKESSPLKAFNS